MRKGIVVCLVALAVWAGPALADPTFYVAPNPYPSTSAALDVPWQTAVGSFIEEDLDGFASGTDIDALTFGSIVADVGLGGLGGTASAAEIFVSGGWGGSAEYGTVYQSALLNRDSGARYGDIVFAFSTPIAGFGAWLYDNNAGSDERFEMVVTEVGGAEYTSSVLDSGNGTAHFVEGWLAATSSVGITAVTYRVLGGNGEPVGNKFFEMDHLQLSPVPVPGAVLLGMLGLGVAGVKLRKRRA